MKTIREMLAEAVYQEDGGAISSNNTVDQVVDRLMPVVMKLAPSSGPIIAGLEARVAELEALTTQLEERRGKYTAPEDEESKYVGNLLAVRAPDHSAVLAVGICVSYAAIPTVSIRSVGNGQVVSFWSADMCEIITADQEVLRHL